MRAQVPTDTAQRPAPVVDTMPRRDTVINPRPDQARGVDAELRAALYEIATDRPLIALTRLEFLRTSPVALTGDTASRAAVSRRQDLLFLLAQTYYRLGVGERFRGAAQDILNGSPSGRYAGLLRLQLMVDAYRRGDYGRATELAAGAGVATDRGLTALIAGLVAYNQGNVSQARTSFATAIQSGGPFTPYARYMDAIAMARADTSQRVAAIDALRQVAGSATGEVADQIRLGAAQLAYGAQRYDDAISIAGQIDAGGGLGAQGLLTRAWAQFRANQLDAAASSFTEFATRHPNLPERDEARVLTAQIMLQQGRTAEAERVFQAIADSLTAEATSAQGRAAVLGPAARALVTARASGLLFLSHPAAGKTLAFPDATGADVSVLAGVFADSAAGFSTEPPAPDVVTLADVEVRLDTISSSLGPEFPRRVLYVPASAENLGRYAQAAERLAAGDVLVAMAQLRLQELLDVEQLRLATLQRLQEVIAAERSRLDTVTARLTSARDSLARISELVDDVAITVRDMLRASATETRELAQENLAKVDSTRAALGASAGTTESTILQFERSTAEIYLRLGQVIEQNVDSAMRRHPVVALRDSLQQKLAHAFALVDSVRRQLDVTQQIVAGTPVGQGGESERVQAARAALAAAQAAQAQGEAQVIAVVDAELRARAGRMIAQLRKDAEAAEFGSASAAFFQVVEPTGTRAAGTQGRAGGTGVGTVAGGERATPAPVMQSPTPR
jgi:tetratricopeptide (TPR) repeat protein